MKLTGRTKQAELPKVEIIISNRSVVRVLVMVALTILGLAALNKVAGALILIFMAFFLALALNAPVHWIAEHLPGKRRGSRSVATSISFLLVVALLVGFLALIIPPTVSQISSFIKEVPGLVEDTRHQDNALGKFIRDNNLDSMIDNVSDELSEVAKNSGSTAVSTLSAFGSSVFAVLTVLVMTFMMLVEGPRWVRLGQSFLPPNRREHVTRLTRDMYKVVRGYVNGQVTIAFIASFFILPVLLILNIPYALALAAVVFICGLIPMIGAYIGATIVSLVALLESPLSALLILAYYILYQQIENYVIQPRIQANATNISPLVVFASVIIGINLNGIIGGLVAIPIVGCLRILVIDYLQSRGKLGRTESKRLTAGAK